MRALESPATGGVDATTMITTRTRSPSERGGACAADGAGASAKAEVVLIDLGNRLDPGCSASLEASARAALGVMGSAGEVRVKLVGDREMGEAHLRHLGDPGTTDVITFNLGLGNGTAAPLDVDLLVCVDEAERQGAARGTGVERELLLYIVHGVLHCLGHDDADEDSALAMHRLEDEVLAAAGIGAVFAPPASGGSVRPGTER